MFHSIFLKENCTTLKNPYLAKKGVEGRPVVQGGEAVVPLHEGLGQSPGTRPRVPAHHVHAVRVGRRRLSGEVRLCGAPVRMAEVVVPAVVPLLLILVGHVVGGAGDAAGDNQQACHHQPGQAAHHVADFAALF